MAQHFKLTAVSLSKTQNWWLSTEAVLPELAQSSKSVAVPDMRLDTVVVRTTGICSHRLTFAQHRVSGSHPYGTVELNFQTISLKAESLRGMRRGLPRGHRSLMKTIVASNLQDADKAELITSTSSLHREAVHRDGGPSASVSGSHNAEVSPLLDGLTTRSAASANKWQIMGLDPSPELVAIAMVYFVQGILGLARLGVTYLFKDDFSLDPAQVALLTGIAGAPWVVKPLYGFLSDTVPIMGYRRRSYLIICGLLGNFLTPSFLPPVPHGSCRVFL
eukprot:jgi/Botrbrau1/11960/Bobra.341_1s0025.1